MTSTEIRQSFLDFFKSKGHTLVPSSSLMPDSPNLLFTNAGMNQFVPIFLGQVKCPYSPGRAADTQKCIRAGGKHNDLEDVGLDTYHHTFFEMLGNWSFGDYFKKEAIDWAWELVTEVWKFPKNRLYATVYSPDKSKGDPSDFDQEAYDAWAEKFRAAGLDPKVHIVNGNKKDNFWMMGDTGPCGPCSELHVDLTPQGDTKGRLVNQATAECIEIWNLVFIQFNARITKYRRDDLGNGLSIDVPIEWAYDILPAKSVDTGMGFERVTSIIQNTRNFTDFNRTISNYETDIFRPIFDRIEKLSGKKYHSTLPAAGTPPTSEQEKIDVAFRVIADHIRTLSFAIADGIEPGNKERNAVLRRILRRAAMFGRSLGFHQPFFYKLVSVLTDTMGHIFPELCAKQNHIEEVILHEEEAFNKTLDDALEIFEGALNELKVIKAFLKTVPSELKKARQKIRQLETWEPPKKDEESIWDSMIMDPVKAPKFTEEAFDSVMEQPAGSLRKVATTKLITLEWAKSWKSQWKPVSDLLRELEKLIARSNEFDVIQERVLIAIGQMEAELPEIERKLISVFPGSVAFKLFATYGLPIEEVQRLARGARMSVDMVSFSELNEEHKAISRAGQTRQIVEVSQVETTAPTQFVGFDKLESPAKVLEVVGVKDKTAVILDVSPFYAEMGGQVGDTGEMSGAGELWTISNTQKAGDAWLHFLADDATRNTQHEPRSDAPTPGSSVTLTVDRPRREAIQRHHTVTHLLHWALHEVVSKDATQKGSYVGPEKLTFDFSSAALTPQQVADVERLVNERILENAPVTWIERNYSDIKGNQAIRQFFGEKYGDVVRVLQIGGKPGALDGYSMELCGGTHTRATGEIGLFRIVGESAIAAGIRRIEAVSGLEAYRRASDDLRLIKAVAGKVSAPVGELEKKIESLLAQQKALEKQVLAMVQERAARAAQDILSRAQTINGTPALIERFDTDGEKLQGIANELKGQFKGVIVLGGVADGTVALVASVSPEFTKQVQAGKIIQAIAPIVSGKGGGRPDNARGGGKDVTRLDEALAKARSLLG